MKTRHLIESVQCDLTGDMFFPVVVAEARFCSDEGEPFWLSAAEVDGTVQFYRTADSTFELQLDPEDSEAVGKILAENLLWAGEYDELFEAEPSEWMPMFRYLICLIRADWDDCSAFIAETEGHYLEELEVPMSDVEEEFLEECSSDDDPL